jgi:hypothetical protein
MVPTCLLVQPPPKVEGGERRKGERKGREEGLDGVVGGDIPSGVCQQRSIVSFEGSARAWDHLRTTVSTLDLKF